MPLTFSQPTLFSPTDFKRSPVLTTSVLALVNTAFYRSKVSAPAKWDNDVARFSNAEALFAMLGEHGVMALVFDLSLGGAGREAPVAESAWSGEKVVACAAVVPWQGGWSKEGAEAEEGWEMKIVCVDGAQGYLRMGLAVKAMSALEEVLVAGERTRVRRNAGGESVGNLVLWILAAECINGAYWRRRGYEEVRRTTEKTGTWGCKTSFEMVVFRKIVRFDVTEG